jgi:hypothetical protein
LKALIEVLGAAISGGRGTVERGEIRLEQRIRPGFSLGRRDAGLEPAEHVQPHRLVGRRFVEVIVAGEHARLHAQRYPQVGELTARLADERGGHDADNRKSGIPDRQRSADHIGAAAESALPEVVADHGFSRVDAIGVRGEHAAGGRIRTQHLEVGARDHAAAHLFRRLAANACLPEAEAALRGHHRREDAGTIAELLKLLVRHPVARPVGAAVPASPEHPRFGGIGEHHQFLGPLHARKRGPQDTVPEAEEGGVGTDAERERENRNGGETRPRRQGSQRVTEVLQQHVPMLPGGDREYIACRSRPDGGATGAARRVVQLIGEGEQHLLAVLVAKRRRITPQQRTVQRDLRHQFSGTRPVSRACRTSPLSRATSAAATRRPKRVSR